MARYIESPGVQISEIDLSLNAGLPIGTNIMVNGFTDQGPSQELLNVTTIDEYEQIYGVPTNAAERYSYHTMKNLLATPAKVIFNRLPYGVTGGTGFNNAYTALMYPIYSENGDASDLSASGDYYIGAPTQTFLTESEYNGWKQGNIVWNDTTLADSDTIDGFDDAKNAGLIIVNKIQTSVNQDFEGYYVAMSDNTKANTTATASDFEFNSVSSIQTSKGHTEGVTVAADWEVLSAGRLDFELSGNLTDSPNSISEAVESIPSWNFGESEYDDGLIIGLYKFRRSGYATGQNQLKYIPYESWIGSLGADRKYTDPVGFQEKSFFIESVTNENSAFLDVMVNPEFSKGPWLDEAGVPNKKIRVLDEAKATTAGIDTDLVADKAYTLGLYQESVHQVKEIGDIPTKLKLGLRLAEDFEALPLDIVLDAGLSTIHTTMKVLTDEVEFDDTKFVSDISDLEDTSDGPSSDIALAWNTIFSQFDIFCRDVRKDCMFIADTYRNILINGKNFKTLDDKEKNFSQHAYTPLKNLTSAANTSYAATYAQWCKVYDGASKDYAWVPYSGFQGAIMSKLDATLYPWSAPAGLENGIVVGALDFALKTTQKHRDLLYRNNINAVVWFPTDGMACWGQKTLQKKPSAFDRINVRRLFLTLEKSTRDLMKYFVFQPNSTFTRTRVVNILTPIFDIAKNNEGVYDYLIVCDERNNTPQVIDSNELVVDIYLKPVRTAEFILVNFYATRTDQNFSELI